MICMSNDDNHGRLIAKYQGKDCAGDLVAFEPMSDPWLLFNLPYEHRIMRLRLIVKRVIKLDGITNELGEPVYTFDAEVVSDVQPV